jgi:hypothetical protein
MQPRPPPGIAGVPDGGTHHRLVLARPRSVLRPPPVFLPMVPPAGADVDLLRVGPCLQDDVIAGGRRVHRESGSLRGRVAIESSMLTFELDGRAER